MINQYERENNRVIGIGGTVREERTRGGNLN